MKSTRHRSTAATGLFGLMSVLSAMGCKPDIDPAVIEAKRKSSELICSCVAGGGDPFGCVKEAEAKLPEATLADGFGSKYSPRSLEAYDAAARPARECAEAARRRSAGTSAR